MNSGTSENLTGIWGTATNNVYACGETGTVLRFNGTEWKPLEDNEFLVDFSGMFGITSNDLYLVGDRNHIVHYSP